MQRTVVVVALLAAVSLARTAHAACPDWRARVDVVLTASGAVKLGSSGLSNGMRVRYSLTNPRPKAIGLTYAVAELAAMMELRDGVGRPVAPLPPRYDLSGTEGHAPYELILEPYREPSVMELEPSWLVVRKAGPYKIRFGFKFKDVPSGVKSGVKFTAATCEAWSEWADVEFHPVVATPASSVDSDSPMIETGILVGTYLNEVFWAYLDEPGKPIKKVPLGRTVDGPRSPGDPTSFAFKDLDARVGSDGFVHLVVPIAGGKTAYTKMGPKGRVVERKEFAGSKVLAGPSDRIELRDKPAVRGK